MVTSPSGGTREVPIYGGQALVYGEEVGFYEVQAGSETQRVAANLSDPNESQIAPKELELPGQEVASDTNELFFNREELWIWAILILLALLVLEWWTYNRRITV